MKKISKYSLLNIFSKIDYFTIGRNDIIAKCGLHRIKLKHNITLTSNLIRQVRSKHQTPKLLKRSIKKIEKQENVPAEVTSTSNAVSI